VQMIGHAVKFEQPQGWPYAELPEGRYGLENAKWKVRQKTELVESYIGDLKQQ